MSISASNGSEDYHAFQLALQDALGIVVGDENRGQIEGRLQPVMLRARLDRLSDLARALRDESSNSIRSEVLEAITTHTTNWFCYPDIYRLMSDYVLPSLIEKQRQDCRIWYAGCGQGQGVYSLAMALAEQQSQLGSEIAIEIVASDASGESIEVAETGRYTEAELDGLSVRARQKYMLEQGEGFEVEERVRDMIRFRTCDMLTEMSSLGHFDVIVSPHILMYFSVGLKRQILDDYATALDPSGILIVNNGEAVIPFCDRFEMIEHEIMTFYRQVS